jgi:hypothetical protein
MEYFQILPAIANSRGKKPKRARMVLKMEDVMIYHPGCVSEAQFGFLLFLKNNFPKLYGNQCNYYFKWCVIISYLYPKRLMLLNWRLGTSLWKCF